MSQNTIQLYMNNLEPYMDDQFLFKAFSYFGEVPKYIKCLNKYGDGSGFCYIHFPTEKSAIASMHKLNGKVIPNSNPPVRFRLTIASSSRSPSTSEKEISLWVGELSSDVDDYQLYKAFSAKYHTIRSAKVVLDSAGYSKGYGFLKFGSEDEQKHCLSHMNGYTGLGSKAIKVSSVSPKGVRVSNSLSSSITEPVPEFKYWKNYLAWSKNYYDMSATAKHAVHMNTAVFRNPHSVSSRGDELELIDHTLPMDVSVSNQELMERDFCFWDALEASKWLPVEKIDD